MIDLVNHFFWWFGVVVFTVACITGLSNLGLWMLDRALKSLGYWPKVVHILRRIHEEKKR